MQEDIPPLREMLRRLPTALSDLFPPECEVRVEPTVGADDGIDAVASIRGSRLLLHATLSSRPGAIDAAARALRGRDSRSSDDIAVVVPYMSAAGTEAARSRDLNWLDLSGNAHLFGEDYYVHVEGRPNRFARRGRPSSPFAPKSARIARTLLLDPCRWWRQADLAETTQLDDGQVSRVVRALDAEHLLDRDGRLLRPRDPALLLDAWQEDYAFDRHDVVSGHMSGTGPELAQTLTERLTAANVGHAFTGLPAAWALDQHARFRLCSVYVHGDPRDAAESIALRREERGANVQLIGPDDDGVFTGRRSAERLPIVAPVQIFLDLLALPERAEDAAAHLRPQLWDDCR